MASDSEAGWGVLAHAGPRGRGRGQKRYREVSVNKHIHRKTHSKIGPRCLESQPEAQGKKHKTSKIHSNSGDLVRPKEFLQQALTVMEHMVQRPGLGVQCSRKKTPVDFG